MKIIEYTSNLKLILMPNVQVFIQLKVVKMVSAPSFRKIKRGRRLTRNEVFSEDFTIVVGHSEGRGRAISVESNGMESRPKMISSEDVIVSGVRCMAAAWVRSKIFSLKTSG